ncbi:MAG: argininosuccinate lyase [Thermodesulfobacteria bacterium]|nr:argininosuccinate lyase [Thermodesulfobacteriota bacterium]
MERDNTKNKKLWGGRFGESTESTVEDFTESVSFDKRLYAHDIRGSIAHARMLGETGIIPKEDADKIIQGLEEIRSRIEAGEFQWKKELEDVHMNIEQALTELIGPAGGRLHTARSRNDQVATDFRLYLRDEIEHLDGLLKDLQLAFLHQAETNLGVILAGFTHLQKAQPVLYSHHMLAYFEMFKRDRERLADCLKRVNISPLGSAALAGTSYPIDRHMTARELGFSDITRNSMDAVSDRDFALEFLFCASVIMMHLSRLCEELILWMSWEFSYIELPDAYCTGSSIMPQKKNPDVPELVRGKTGRVYGALVSLLTTLKGLPLTYNRDLQEDKELVFDTIDTVRASVKLMTGVVEKMRPRADKMAQDTQTGFLTATDLADYLVKKGLPFRQAHEVVGKAVGTCVSQGKELHELPIEELKALHPLIDDDVLDVLSVEGSVHSRRCPGGTGIEPVKEALSQAKTWIEKYTLPSS